LHLKVCGVHYTLGDESAIFAYRVSSLFRVKM
jgi:hypothetical protein